MECSERKKRPARIYIGVLAAALLVFAAAAFATMGDLFAKYRRDSAVYGTLSVEDRLAESFALLEHKVGQNEDGTYYLLTGDDNLADPAAPSSYFLIPGTSIPKDPHIRITGKTPTPAFLYVEVVEVRLDAAVSYEIAPEWELLAGTTGPHGGRVYSYGSAPISDATSGLDQIYIIKDNMLNAPPDVLPKVPIRGQDEALTFIGYMAQQMAPADTAKATFEANWP